MLWAAGAAFAVAVAAVLAAVVMVRWPRQDHPRHADAIVVLSGDHGERLALAQRLLSAGVAHILVFAGQPDSATAAQMCRGGQPFQVVCVVPHPDSTRTEAQALGRLARQRHWTSIVVATSQSHIARARLLFQRCVGAQVQVVGAHLPFGGRLAVAAWAHEVAGMLYARIWARGC